MMDLVSVIIPYYKKERYIEATIRSVLNQNYKNLEILIVYDDSNKSDLGLIKKIIKFNKKIKLIINKKNIGAANSRNKGIKKCRGKYISFIDSDDLWKKNKIKSQLEFMKKNNVTISHTSYEIINENNNKIGIMKVKKDLVYRDLIYSCDIGLSTVMINSKIKKKLNFPNIKTKEDYVLWLKLSKKNKIYGIQKNLVLWRKNNNSLSYTIQKIKDAFTVYSKYQKFDLIKSIFSVIILSINFFKKNFKQKISFKKIY
jgi:teichuronic acid biosynthesis glycosyltransferase TuaG